MLFSDNFLFFRNISHNPILIKPDGSISSAAFKDPNGCSVDQMGNREVHEVYSSFIHRFKNTKFGIKGIAKITYQICKDVNVHVEELPSKNNKYHCELHKSRSEVLLTQSQARYLAKHCQFDNISIIEGYKI